MKATGKRAFLKRQKKRPGSAAPYTDFAPYKAAGAEQQWKSAPVEPLRSRSRAGWIYRNIPPALSRESTAAVPTASAPEKYGSIPAAGRKPVPSAGIGSAQKHIDIREAEKNRIRTAGSAFLRPAANMRKHLPAEKGFTAAPFRHMYQRAAAADAATGRPVKKRAAAVLKTWIHAAARSMKSISGAAAAASAGVLAPLCIVLLTGALLLSPVGVFFTDDVGNAMTLRDVMMQLDAELGDRILEIENSVPHDTRRQDGHRASWKEILTVYAVKTTTDPERPMDAATMDEAHLESLQQIFRDMNAVSYTTETYTETETTEIEVQDEAEEAHTETQIQTVDRTRLVIHVAGKTAMDMAAEYGFSQEQLRYVSELLSEEYAGLWAALAIPGAGSGDIVEVAERELRDYGGTACGSRYWPQPEDWCVDFVMWCGNELGYVGAGGIFGPGGSNVSAELDSMISAGAEIYYPGDGTIPQPGDIIAFWDDIGRPGNASDGVPLYQGLLSHTGIVTEGTDTTVTIIEGNAGGGGYNNSTLKKNTYSLNGCAWRNTYIFCFVRPQYPFTGPGRQGEFWFSSHSPGRVRMMADEDPAYGGHPVTVTDEEMRAIVYTIYREMGTDPDGCMLIAQELRDQFDYLDYIGSDYPSWSEVTWERIIKASWNPDYWNTGRNLRLGNEHQYAYDAFRWVFDQGNSAIPHKIFGHMSSDIGFQASWWYRVAFFDPNVGWDTYFWATDIFDG